jgi:hypothetical protein
VGGGGGGGTLRPLSLVPKQEKHPPFALESTFEEGAAAAALPPLAWDFEPPAAANTAATPLPALVSPPSLVWPLNEVVDEVYSVYFVV